MRRGGAFVYPRERAGTAFPAIGYLGGQFNMRLSAKLVSSAVLAVALLFSSGQAGVSASGGLMAPAPGLMGLSSKTTPAPTPSPASRSTPSPTSHSTPSATSIPTLDPAQIPAPRESESIPKPADATSPVAPSPDVAGSAAAKVTPSPEAAVPELSVGATAIGARWADLGGKSGRLGPSVSAVICGLEAGGCLQRFEHGAIHWSEATGAHPTSGPIAARWATLNWESGKLGYPLSAQRCGLYGSGCVQNFQGGAIHWSTASGANPTWGSIAARWATLNWEAGQLGYPLNAERCGLRGNGCVQNFQHGAIYRSAAGGAQPVWGAILASYGDQAWESGRLGYPLTGEICGLRDKGCLQRFEHGAIHWSPASGAFGTTAAIAARWASLNWESGRLGYPVSQERCGLRDDGCVQRFQGGAIYWSPFGGAQPMWGAILGTYGSRGWEAGSLGYPVSAEQCGSSCVQEFQYGKFTWSAAKGIDFHLRSDGYCEALNRGSVRYNAKASRVSFAIAEGYYPEQRVTFATCVRGQDGFRLEWVVPGFAGESGFAGPGVASGPTINKYSPTGAFTVTEAFGLGNPGTALSYRHLNPYSRWGGRLNANYNKYFESSADIFPDENMWYYATRPSHDYRQGVVINYNRPPDSPIVMNAGFAIFLHANRVPTWGCISLNEADIVRFQRSAVPGDKIVMGVVDDVFW